MWRRSQAEGLLASASLPSYRGAGCRGFSIQIGMCHQRPHPLRWGSRDLYGASWPRAMCPRGTRGTRAPGLRGSIAHSATPNARCACHSPPPSGTAFYDNCTYVDFRATRRHRVRGLPATRRRRVAPVRQRGSGVIKEMGGTGWHAARSHREGGGTGRQRDGLRSLTRRDSRCDLSLRGTVPGRAAHKAASAVDVQGYPAHPWKATIERESAYKVTMR